MQYNCGVPLEIRHSLWQIKNNASYSRVVNTTSVHDDDPFRVSRCLTDLEFGIKKETKKLLRL